MNGFGFEYGYTGTTDQPNKMRKITVDDLLRQGTPQTPPSEYTPQASLATELEGTPATAMPTSGVGGVDWLNAFGQGVQSAAPLLMRMGQALTYNPNDPRFSTLIGLGAQATETMKLNEALRKMIAQGLAGGGQGPTEGPAVSAPALSGLDVLGLNPEQVASLYSTGLTLREKERQYPLTALKTYSEAFRALQAGNLDEAQTAMKNLELQMLSDPANVGMTMLGKYIDLQKKMAETQNILGAKRKTEAEAAKIEKEVPYAGDIEKYRAEKLKREAEESIPAEAQLKKAQAGRLGYESSELAHKRALELKRAEPFSIHSTPEGYVIYNKATGATTNVPIDAKTPASTVDKLSLMMATSTMLPFLEEDFMKKLPGDVAAARQEWANFLAVLNKEQNPEARDALVRGRLSPENMNKYNQILDLYRVGIENKVPTAALDNMARQLIVKSPTTKPTPEATPKQGTPPKTKPSDMSPRAQGFTNVAPVQTEKRLRDLAAKANQTLVSGKLYKDPQTGEIYYYFGDKFYAK